MASITTWVRIEPRARDADLLASVEARLHDPLWLLARQWQLGELTGTDGGSSIIARTRAEIARIDAVGGDDWTAIDPDRAPIAAVLAPRSGEPGTRPELYRRARAGRHLLRLVGPGSASDAMLARFSLTVTAAERAALDAGDLRFLATMTGRVPDGDAAAIAIAQALADPSALLPSSWGIAAPELAAATAAARAWLAWRADLECSSATPAWHPEELAYRYRLHAAGSHDVTLAADRQTHDEVRWSELDVTSLSSTPDPDATIVSTSIPTRTRYRGMPARRYWELEDAAVHWPSIDAGPGDLGRILFVELGLAFGEHWLEVPLEVPAASIVRVASLVVTDTFGVRSVVRAASELDGGASPWRFLELSRPPATVGPLVFVLPSSTHLTGRDREAVHFARDDAAGVLWAVDRTLPGADGRARDITAASPARPRPPVATYRLGPAVDPAYHPYRAREDADGLALVLSTVPGAPATRPDLPARIRAHALPARAIRISQRAQLVRSSDGAYHGIVVRTRADAPAPAAPALTFDTVEDGV